MSFEHDEKRRYRNASEIEMVVRGFESCTREPDAFSHAEHLLVGLCYLTQSTLEESLERMRDGLRRFLWHHSKDLGVYNETITLFWLKRLQSFLQTRSPRPTLVQLASEMLESFPDSKLIYSYYSRERLDTREARTNWVEPDLRPLDF